MRSISVKQKIHGHAAQADTRKHTKIINFIDLPNETILFFYFINPPLHASNTYIILFFKYLHILKPAFQALRIKNSKNLDTFYAISKFSHAQIAVLLDAVLFFL